MRSLADDLRARSDEQLAALVLARPDLLHPMPLDLTSLAQRAGSAASVAAALRGYDQRTLHVALAAALGGDPVRPSAVAAALRPHLSELAARGEARAAIARLRADALLWGTDRNLHLVGAARDLLVPPDRGPRVAALDPVVAGFARDPGALADLVAAAPEGVSAVLGRLLGGPVVGTVSDAHRVPDPARSPIDWLLAEHVLVPVGADRVALPAEVASILRGADAGDPSLAMIDLATPAPGGAPRDPARLDPGSVGAILDALHRTAELGRLWASSPPSRLRTGGIPARDLTRTAKALAASEPATALLIEVAAAAGLISADGHDPAAVLPTAAFDSWLAELPAQAHAHLLAAWLAMPRAVASAGQRPMAPELVAPTLPDLRRDVLGVLVSADGDWTDDEVIAAVDWWAPRRHDAARAQRVRTLLAEARELGLVVGGTATGAGRALAAPEADPVTAATAALALLLPEQVDQLILQADLTAIVPGLPTPALADLLRTVADAESVGSASVYRFSAASVRRALDAGRTADDLLRELGQRGALPQPLAYLITDTARAHAVLRIGAAGTYLRCDDPVVLAAVMADPGSAALGLFALSESVLASAQPPEHVLERLSALGHSLLPEPGRGPTPDGPRRARGRAGSAGSGSGSIAVSDGMGAPGVGGAAVTPALAAAAIRALRARDLPEPPTRPRRARRPVPVADAGKVSAELRRAIATQAAVWIGYADPAGVAQDHQVEPLHLAGGYLTALDLTTRAMATFALARITGVQAP